MQLGFFKVVDNDEPDDSEAVSGAIDYGLIQKRALAAEHLVAADILQRNWDCSFAAAALRYDLIADVGGLRRVQVKMALRPCLQGGVILYYKFGCGAATSISRRSEGRLNHYKGEIDLFALVAFDIKRIIYVHPDLVDTQKIFVRESEFTAERSDLSWRESLRGWGIR